MASVSSRPERKLDERVTPRAALLAFAHLLCEFNQFGNDLRGFDGAILVTADGSLQHFTALSHRLVKVFLKPSEHLPNLLRLAEVGYRILN